MLGGELVEHANEVVECFVATVAFVGQVTAEEAIQPMYETLEVCLEVGHDLLLLTTGGAQLEQVLQILAQNGQLIEVARRSMLVSGLFLLEQIADHILETADRNQDLEVPEGEEAEQESGDVFVPEDLIDLFATE